MSTSSARKKNQLDPIKPSDTPDQVNAKLKIINELLSNTDSDTINKEEKKQYLFLLENLSQKEIENILGPHPEYKALLCCCFIELIRILSTDNELVGKKAEFMFRMIIDTVKNAKTVLEKNARNQLVYLLHQLEKTRACKIFITDNYTELGKTFIQYLLGNETELVQYPDIFYQTQKLLISIFEVSFNFVSDDNLQYILLPILLSLQKELSKSKQFELSKNTIKELSWGARNLCGKLCIDLFKKKDVYRKVQIEQEHILSIIYYLFKIDYDIIRGIWPYLESETNVLIKKEQKKSYMVLIAKICSFKGSEVSTNCPQIFNFFVENLTMKKNRFCRIELLERAFKYLKHFTYCKRVSDLEINTSTVKYDVFRKNLSKIEIKLKELLYEGDEDVKLYVLDNIQQLVLSNSQYISQAVINDVANLLYWSKERNKDRVIILLAEIYNHYCCTLYEEDVFDFDDKTGNFILVNGFIDSTLLQRKEAAKSFQWIGENIILYHYQAKKIEFPLLHSALTKIFGLQNYEPKSVCKRLIGFFHNIKAYRYKDANLDIKNFKYSDFVNKILDYNWFDDEDIKKSTYNFLYEGLVRVLNNFLKVVKNFKNYILAVLDSNEQKKEEAIRNLKRYLLNQQSLEDLEKELVENLNDKDLKDYLLVALNPLTPGADKRTAIQLAKEKLKHPSWHYLLDNYCVHPFCPEVYDKLGYFSLLFAKKDIDYSIYLREGVIDLLNFLIKNDKETPLANHIGDLVNHVAENFTLLITSNPYAEQEGSTIPQDKGEISKKKMNKNLIISYQAFAKNCLALLSKLDLSDFHEKGEINNLEDIKNELGELIKRSQLSPQQTKFAAKIIIKLDKITSENIAPKLCENLIQYLDVRSNFLHANIRGVIELLKSDRDLFIYHMNTIEEFTRKLIQMPVPLPKHELISELTQCKKHLIKLLYKSYFTQELSIINDNYTKNARKFRSLLMELLLNFQIQCAGHMKTDRDYLRIYALIYLLDILARENTTEVEPELFAKLGILCYDDNDDLKRVLFSTIINKKNKRNHSLPNILFLLALFMNSANDENLKYVSLDIFNKEIERYAEDYIQFVTLAKKEDIMKSPEYLLIYILFLMSNNPILLLNAKTIPHHVYKCVEVFLNAINNSNNPNRGEYFMNILHRLEDCEPIIFQENTKTSIEFTDLKQKKTVRKPTYKEMLENPNMSFREVIFSLILFFREKFGNKAVYTKRLPVILPPGYYMQSIGRNLDVPRATPLILLESKVKSSLLSPVVELPIKRLEFDDNDGEIFVIRKAVDPPEISKKDDESKKEESLKDETNNKGKEEEKKVFVPVEEVNPKGNKKKGKKNADKETQESKMEEINPQAEESKKGNNDTKDQEKGKKKGNKKKSNDENNPEIQEPNKKVKKTKK